MISKLVVTEEGQPWLAGLEDGVIVRALPTEDTDPEILNYADAIFIERLEDAVQCAPWLEREHAEGRTMTIEAYFTVNV